MKTITPRLMILAAAMAGLIACDNAKKVEQEQQDLTEQRQEVQKEQAELTQEHRKEQADLAKDRAEELRPDDRANAPMAAPNAERIRDTNEEAAELNREQQKERADLRQDNAEELRGKEKDVVEAKQAVNEERAEIVSDKSEKLRKLETRVQEVQAKAQTETEGQKAQQVTAALSTFPTQRQAIERDIEALKTVTETNLNRAKDSVEKKLSSLEKVVDKAESRL